MPKGKAQKEDRWQNIEYYIKRNPSLSLEECQKICEQKLLEHRQKHPTSIEYWIKNNPDKSGEECKVLLEQYKKEHNYQCVEYYQRLHPDLSYEECKKLRDDRVNKGINKRPDNTGKNNPAHHSKTTTQQRKERSAMCIEYWEKKYPNLSHEEHIKLMKEHTDKVKQKLRDKSNQPKCIEFWIKNGYTEEEAKAIISKSQQTFSKQKCIEKYGEEMGLRIFVNRQMLWQRKLRENFEKNGDGRGMQSHIARSLFDTIYKKLKLRKEIKEKYIYDTINHRAWAYDFHYKNILIEFNGDYWHMNPNKYQPTDINPTTKQTAQEKWDEDRKKIECAESHNYKVYTIWESDYKNNPKATIEKCLEFIKENI